MTGCVSKDNAPPQWQRSFDVALHEFRDASLSGDFASARIAARAAERAALAGGDADRVSTLLLTSCMVYSLIEGRSVTSRVDRLAADVSFLKSGCDRFGVLPNGFATREQTAYAVFLSNAPMSAEVAAQLPLRYRPIAFAMLRMPPVRSELSSIVADLPDPLSRLTATVAVARRGYASVDLLKRTSEESRAQGWRVAHVSIDHLLLQMLRETGDLNDANRVAARLRVFDLSREQPSGAWK